VKVWPASSAPPPGKALAKPAMVFSPESSLTFWLPPTVRIGSSLIGAMMMSKLWSGEVSSPPLPVPPESVTDTVTVAVPTASALSV